MSADMLSAASATPDQGRSWRLRTVLVASLLTLSILPAATVGWFLYRSNLQSVDRLAEETVASVAQRLVTDTDIHLGQAHVALNGLIHERPNSFGLLRARQLIEKPELFEQTAFAMTRMSGEVPSMALATAQGDFLGIESESLSSDAPLRVGVRTHSDEGRRFYAANSPGERDELVSVEDRNFEPRTRPWYQAAMESKGRTFTDVYPAQEQKQLQITLAQPVYGTEGSALGVFAIDLHLKHLNDRLQATRISGHGAAFLVDEQGFLVASSTGDALFQTVDGQMFRTRPQDSRNAIVRNAYAQAAAGLGKTLESSVQRQSFLRRTALGDDTLLTVLKPFGESQGVRWSLVVSAPESDFTAASSAALRQALLVAAITLAIGAVLALALALRLSRRIRRLSYVASRLSLAEELPAQERSRITEVRALSTALHDSAQELQRNRAAIQAQTLALQDANETLEARVVSRTAELAASREEALGAARAKAAFLATMSHEIRTPLNGVVGMTTLLADTPLDPEQQDYVHTMRISSDQLLGVINDILDFSKIESGKLELEDEPLNLLGTIEEACDIGAPRAREKGLELLVDIGDELPGWVRGDVTRLRQVLLNLVNNAVKFTERGQIIVSAHMLEDFTPGQGGLIEFRIQDTGIGIPLERQSALFESFAQVDASTTRKYGGTGLGLAICKRLAALMGGSAGLESEQGVGSTFWFTARLGFTDAPEASMLSSLHLVSMAGKVAVVVDDTSVNLRILDKQLRRWGMQTHLFDRAVDAQAWLAKHSVDVIVTDMHMPEIDGQTFTQTLRDRGVTTPIVLLTSGTMPTGDKARVFDARLLKPYRQSQLFESLARVTTGAPAAKSVTKAAPATAKNQFILVADDNAVNLKVALAMLSKLGYEAATAMNGREAVDRVAASLLVGRGEVPRPYAAILMDVNMPTMDGFEASRLIINSHGQMAPPIIALTASVLEEDRQRCMQAGMVGFLPKPLRIDELSEALAQYARQPPGEHDTHLMAANEAEAAPADAAEACAVPADDILMDWSRLDQFKEFDDDERTMTREVLNLFIAESPQRIDDIRAALAAFDSAALSRAAHAVKGAASNVGAHALSEACSTLERCCQQGQWPADAAAQVARISVLTDKTRQALNAWVG